MKTKFKIRDNKSFPYSFICPSCGRPNGLRDYLGIWKCVCQSTIEFDNIPENLKNRSNLTFNLFYIT